MLCSPERRSCALLLHLSLPVVLMFLSIIFIFPTVSDSTDHPKISVSGERQPWLEAAAYGRNVCVSFRNYWCQKPIKQFHTFVLYHKQQSQLFLAASFLVTSEEERKKKTEFKSILTSSTSPYPQQGGVWSYHEMLCSIQCTMSVSTGTAHSGGFKHNFAKN